MPTNYKLVIEYDGAGYHGWQRQPKAPSIQAEIEAALQTMMGRQVTLIGSGRTDAGVHALGQVANFKCPTRLTPEAVQNGLNSLLPGDIVIRRCEGVSQKFHARYDVKSKIYRYRIINNSIPSAIGRQYAWWIKSPLDLTTMQSAISPLLGRHDFKAFEGSGSPRSHSIRNVLNAALNGDSNRYIDFVIEADGFLRYMVRNIVGTLVEIGRGKRASDDLATTIETRDRSRAGATAPPQGLCLMQVIY